jgi:hypothetical protein
MSVVILVGVVVAGYTLICAASAYRTRGKYGRIRKGS